MAAEDPSPSSRLAELAEEALKVAKKARKHRKSLNGDNFYANKLAQLRAEATIAFSEMAEHSAGDTSALAELIETSFSASVDQKKRVEAKRELRHALLTKWRQAKGIAKPGNELFPLALATKTARGYIITIVNQMNGCRREGWSDASAVMMRRLVEIAIIEAFENKGIAAKIQDANGDYLQLTALVNIALAEPTWRLSKPAKKALPKLKDLGHLSAHGRRFTAQAADIDKNEDGVRVVVEEFLHLAGLL